LGLIY